MNAQSMRPGSILATQGQSRLHRAADDDDQEGNIGGGGSSGEKCKAIDHTPQNGYSSGSDAQRGWVDADGSDDAAQGHRGSGSGGGAGLGTVGNQPGIDSPTPLRRTRKRGRSLRKNVLLRTRGVLMSGINGLGIITPGMVLGSQDINPNISQLTPPPSSMTHHSVGEVDRSITPATSTGPGGTKLTNGVSGSEGARLTPISGYSSTSPAFPSTFIDGPWLPRRDAVDPLADTVWWGWAIMFSTWMVFVVGMGSVLGVWEWAWDVGDVSCSQRARCTFHGK